MLLDALREQTRPHHLAIERNRLLSEVVRPTLTREVYVEVLARFYGFFLPLEDAWLRDATAAGLGALLSPRAKAGLLKKDLVQLGFTAGGLRQIPLCTDLPSSEGRARCLGVLYVIEGSTLGGQLIASAVKKSLGLGGDSGAAYFCGYGAATSPMWKETCRVLSEYGRSPDAEWAETLTAATETFDKLDQWFQKA